MLASAESDYEETGQQGKMVFMAPEGAFYDGNAAHWADKKQPSFPRSTYSDNTNWETVDVCMGVYKEAIIKVSGRVNALLECWGCTNSPRYYVDRFHT